MVKIQKSQFSGMSAVLIVAVNLSLTSVYPPQLFDRYINYICTVLFVCLFIYLFVFLMKLQVLSI